MNLLIEKPAKRIIMIYRITQMNIGFLGRCSFKKKTEHYGPITSSEEIDEFQSIKNKLNKSRLLQQHRDILYEKLPYMDSQSWIHLTEKYQRGLYGRYGTHSWIHPRISFKTYKDVQLEVNNLREPYSIRQMLAKLFEDKIRTASEDRKRESDVSAKVHKLMQWTKELNAKIAKKEADVLKAKERKDRLIEEVRRHFGFKIDPRDDRFKEMLEQKSKEDRKLQKEARRRAKDEKMVAKISEQSAHSN